MNGLEGGGGGSYQPLDSDLTAVAALVTEDFGLGVLEMDTASAVRSYLGLGEAAVASSTNTEGVAGPGLVLSRAEHTHNLGSSYITGTLPISKGGTGITNGPTNGQLLIGVTTGNQWSRATLTQGTGITVTNGAGSITLAVNEAGLTHNNIGGTLGVSKGGTGITSFSSGIATFLGSASSVNLRAALTDETGTGSAVFSIAPTLAQGTITAPTPVLTLTSTWNDVADTMRGLEINITNSGSAGDSTLIRTTVGGVSMMEVSNGGDLRMLGNGSAIHRIRGEILMGVDATGAAQKAAFGTYGLYVDGSAAINLASNVFVTTNGSGVLKINGPSSTGAVIELPNVSSLGTPSSAVRIGSISGEAWVVDGAGNLTQFSPHALDAPEHLRDSALDHIRVEVQLYAGYVRYTNETRKAAGRSDAVWVESFGQYNARVEPDEPLQLLDWEDEQTRLRVASLAEHAAWEQHRDAFTPSDATPVFPPPEPALHEILPEPESLTQQRAELPDLLAAQARSKTSLDLVDAGYTVQPEGFTLALHDRDRAQFAGMLALVREGLDLGLINAQTAQTIADQDGGVHTVTTQRFREIMVGYGLYFKTLWDAANTTETE